MSTSFQFDCCVALHVGFSKVLKFVLRSVYPQMNSLGTFSKWPSNDSLPTSSSEQTEDEADIFSEGEGHSGRRQAPFADEFSGNCVDLRPYSIQLQSRSSSDQSGHCPETEHSVSSLGAASLGSSPVTPGDLVFAQKCTDLHKFAHPLHKLLKGLKTGRFDKGLTSFQQSVAIDRLQRILGVLQKPDMGEKYLQHLVQIEIMLKVWFPHLAFQSIDKPKQTITPQLPPHWCQNQLHMPVKKRKLSCLDFEPAVKIPNRHKHHQHKKPWNSVSMYLPASAEKLEITAEERAQAAESSCRAGHMFTDSHSTSRRLAYLSSNRTNQIQHELSPPFHCGSKATQDNSVSSTGNVAAND
ncbi:circadian-associated transcriptional repressor-like [Solea senegalensis]|uniref:Circadian-associated transcriptional repressor-like n=1 Tax=Solea senegalensis TaxID=28829 RepID=A0AAV6R657_SOLSE|nr:circadian-associated transcriptional repressor-like [Solea senegalensis]